MLFGILTVFALLILIYWFYHSEFNTTRIIINNQSFNVKQTSSAPVLLEINRRLNILQQHMNQKYKIRADNDKFDMPDRVRQLNANFSNELTEISPNNPLGSTSFTEGKKKIVFCLRNKNGELHDINTLTFVALHEITHVMNDRWGHEKYFWELFKIVLNDAVEAGIYKPVNYGKNLQSYCGIVISQNPYYDL